MKTPLLLTAIFVASIGVYAQKEQKTPEFGTVTMQEMKMSKYDMDTTANAVILFDVGSCSLTDQLGMTFKRHIRIKFFTAEAIDEYATKEMTYRTQTSGVARVKGTTYNLENGVIVASKMAEENIFKKKINKYFSEYKFTLPNVKPGSIIEYTYVMTAELSLLPGWSFQHTIPTIYSEYETITPRTFTFKKDMQGFLGLTDVIQKNDGAYEKLIMRDAPAFKIEPFLTTPEDYLSSVNYSFTEAFVPGHFYNFKRTWTGIAKEYGKDPDFGGLVRGNGWLDKTVEPIIAVVEKPEDKARKIYEWVKSNIAWTDLVDRYPDHPLKKVIEDKKGSSSEINMLLIAMMRRAGIDAYPVLISTRTHGLIRPFIPDVDAFDDVICYVKLDGKDRFFDGTDKKLPYNSLPERCLNGDGLLILEDGGDWIPVVAAKARTIYNANLKLSSEGELTGALTISRDGLHSGDMRSEYSELGKEKYVTEQFRGKSWEVTKSEFANIEGGNDMAKEVHSVVAKDHVQAAGDVMYINPYLMGLEENVFKSETRAYPVHIPTPFDRFYTARIELPADFKVEEIPAQKIFVLPEGGGKFVYSVTQVGNAINFTSQLSITNNVIGPEKYPQLRQFYDLVVAKQAEQIVLKKVK